MQFIKFQIFGFSSLNYSDYFIEMEKFERGKVGICRENRERVNLGCYFDMFNLRCQ